MIVKYKTHYIDDSQITKNSIVLDLGAGEGDFSRWIHRRFGCWPRMAEPNPIHAKKLELLQWDMFWPVAVCASNGRKKFYNYGPGSGSIIKRKCREYSKARMVDCVSFDHVMSSFTNVELCKMDVEGAEADIFLKSKGESILKVRQYSVEFHSKKHYSRETFGEVLKRLDNLGYLLAKQAPLPIQDALLIRGGQ